MQAETAYYTCLQRFQQDPSGPSVLLTLHERGSLAYLTAEGFEMLTPELAEWLLRAESHEGSELIYLNEKDKVRGIPLNSFFNFPKRYADKMPKGAYVSAELEDGRSVILYVCPSEREQMLQTLEAAKKMFPLTTDRPLRERILDKLQEDGHLSYLSREGLNKLNGKLIKYLEYAVNVRPGSEIIYFAENGHVYGDALDKVLKKPEKFANVTRPVYLAIEVDQKSVIFDTHDTTPANVWHLMKKARQIAAKKSEAL